MKKNNTKEEEKILTDEVIEEINNYKSSNKNSVIGRAFAEVLLQTKNCDISFLREYYYIDKPIRAIPYPTRG